MVDVAVDIAEATSGVTHRVDAEQVNNGTEDVIRQVVQLGGDAFADKAAVDATRGVKADSRQKLATSTISQASRSVTSAQVKAANTNREALVLVNESDAVCYVKLGATAASSSSYTYRLDPYSTVTLPDSYGIWTGAVQAVWALAGAGVLAVTELEA